MDSQSKLGPPASRRHHGLLWAVFLGLGALYVAVQPIRHHLAAETERINREARATQAAGATHADNLSDDINMLRVEQSINPHSIPVQLRLAKNYYAAGQLDAAAQCAEAVVQIQPKHTQALILLGDIQRQANHFDSAMRAYRAVLAQDPKNSQALAGMGFLYIAVGWPLEVKTLLEPAVRAAPQDPLLKLPLALAYMQMGEGARAETLLLDVRRLAPDNAALWSALLRLYNDLRRYSETLALADEALAKSSGPQQALILYSKGVAQYQLNDIPGATATLRQAIALRPDNAYAHYHLALCLQRANQLDEAARELEATLQADPTHQQARLALAQFYLRQHRTAEGQRIMAEYRRREALEQKHSKVAKLAATEPGNAQAHWQMALLYQQDRNLPLLVVELRKTLELDPHNREAQRLLTKTLSAAPSAF